MMSAPGAVGGADVVVSSAALLTSVAESVDGFAAALREGRSGMRPGRLPAATHIEVAAHLDGPVDRPSDLLADSDRLGQLRRLTRRAALPTRAAARVGWEATLAARLSAGELARTAVVIGGNNLALGYQAKVAAGFADGEGTGIVLPSHALTHLDTDAIGVVSELTGATAEGYTIGGASASGALALIHGCRLLTLDAVDHCLVIGALSELSPAEYRAFHDTGAMASGSALPPATVCRPFDSRRGGFVHGHGTAAVVLERSGTAQARGAKPLARLAGYAQRLDGKSGTEPCPEHQAETIRAALRAAGLHPGDVDYVNAHATGSRVGDRAEAEALHQVFGAQGPLVNSTKELAGHCLSAAGVVEAIATLVQLRDQFCHPNPNLTEPEDTRLSYVGTAAVPARLRAAVSTSFAFSGVNAAIVMTRAEDT
jgi:malonyl-ACP decarboxylase